MKQLMEEMLGPCERWHPDQVLERLIEAYATIEAVTSRVTRGGSGSAWPAMRLDASERYTGKNLDELEKILKEERDRRAIVAAGSVSQALEAQRWPIDFITNETHRECLIDYATCRARGVEWAVHVQLRNRRLPQKKAWIRQTTYRWIEKSLQTITEKLNNSSSMLSETEHCQMRHDSRTRDFIENGGERIKVWRSPDAEPRPIAEMDLPAKFTVPKPRRSKRRKRVTAA